VDEKKLEIGASLKAFRFSSSWRMNRGAKAKEE
jgi:hypothetical protein